jgi:UDPglucose 6-dehydrogenase
MNKIAIIGLGRLGLCFALNLERIGYYVFGIDTNEQLISEVKNRTLQSNEPQVEAYLQQYQNLVVTTKLNVIEEQNIQFVYLILPTPSANDGSFSHNYINDFLTEFIQVVSTKLKRNIIIGSTVMPGYCDSIAEKLEQNNCSVTYNPEFIAQGTIIHDQQHPDQILIGEGNRETILFLKELYSKMCLSNPAIHIMSRKSAEITKLATNCFLTMKISFANSIGDLARLVGVDEDKILKAIGSDTRIGNKYLKYGFGFGGPCFPRDNQALMAFANEQKTKIPLAEATVQVNQNHLEFQLNELLNLDQETYYFDSVSYKKDTDIIEESQQLELAKLLVKNGKKVVITNSKKIKEIVEIKFPNQFIFED